MQKKLYGILVYIISCLMCLMSAWSTGSLIFNVSVAGDSVSSENSSVTESTEYEPEKEIPDENTTASSAEEIGSSSMPTNTAASALGRISEQVTAYTSGQSSGGVHIRDLTGTDIDISKILKKTPSVKLKNTSAPQVLVLHTHATESFMTAEKEYYTEADATRSTDDRKNMVAIGKTFCETLEKAGIGTVQITTHFDNPAYTGSYKRAKTEIEKYLKKYPTIKVVVDIHRDSITNGTTKTKPTVTIDGKKAAQVMLVMGSGTGKVKNHPKWEENLALAARYQQTMAKNYPKFARCMMVSSKLYNQNLTTGSMLIEIGTEANTFSEANYSASLAATSLAQTLKNLG